MPGPGVGVVEGIVYEPVCVVFGGQTDPELQLYVTL